MAVGIPLLAAKVVSISAFGRKVASMSPNPPIPAWLFFIVRGGGGVQLFYLGSPRAAEKPFETPPPDPPFSQMPPGGGGSAWYPILEKRPAPHPANLLAVGSAAVQLPRLGSGGLAWQQFGRPGSFGQFGQPRLPNRM